MAALTRSRLSYLFTNFANTLAVQAAHFHKTRQALFHCSSFFFANEQMIKMPSLSPTMTEGKIIKWLKKEGDTINPGDVLCDIETDKAVISMETEEEGILAKIVIPENTSNVKVGSLIAVMVPPGEDWKNINIPKEELAPKAADAGDSAEVPKESEAKGEEKPVVGGPPTLPITMPSLSPTMTAGTIVKWLKKEGDVVAPGDVLCDIQTDKAVMSLEAEEEGILAKIIVPDDSKDIKVGTLIAVMVPEGEDWKSVTVTSAPAQRKEVSQPQFTSSSTTGASEVRGKSFGPAVKALLATYQLESGLIKPTGRGNRILKEDVLQYVKDNNLEKKPPKVVSAPSKTVEVKSKSVPPKKTTGGSPRVSKYKDIELTSMRRVIAKRLSESKAEVPHSYCEIKCDVDDLISLKDELKNSGITVTVTDLLTKATVLALQMRPNVNVTFVNNEIRFFKNVDICLAVATENGLYTPIIRSADNKTVDIISKETRELAIKARQGKLKPEEFQGGSFTISNLGMFGITTFKAVINPPQGAILAIGSATECLNADLSVKKQISLTLSSDRRAVTEQEAAEFMMTVKYFVENPKLIVLGLNPSLTPRS